MGRRGKRGKREGGRMGRERSIGRVDVEWIIQDENTLVTERPSHLSNHKP